MKRQEWEGEKANKVSSMRSELESRAWRRLAKELFQSVQLLQLRDRPQGLDMHDKVHRNPLFVQMFRVATYQDNAGQFQSIKLTLYNSQIGNDIKQTKHANPDHCVRSKWGRQAQLGTQLQSLDTLL